MEQRDVGEGTTVRFTVDLVGHAADWRGSLGWMARRYPRYFEPVNSKANEMAGCGAYSGDEDPVGFARLKRMAFRAGLSDKPRIEALHPGVKTPMEVGLRHCEDAVVLTVPLHRGCAMVRIVN
jgi:hypothetical protein